MGTIIEEFGMNAVIIESSGNAYAMSDTGVIYVGPKLADGSVSEDADEWGEVDFANICPEEAAEVRRLFATETETGPEFTMPVLL